MATVKDIKKRSYDRPHTQTYSSQTLDLSSAAVVLTGSGNYGAMGRVRGMSLALSTPPDANTVISVGTSGTPDLFAEMSVESGASGVVNLFEAKTGDDNLIPANTAFEVSVDGAPTAGAGTLTVDIDWF